MSEMKMPLCHVCGSAMERQTLRLVENTRRGDPVVVKDVPAKVCSRCGARVFSRSVSKALLEILAGDRAAEGTVTLELPVYSVSASH